MYDLKSPVAVTAHDAGAANLILGWLHDCIGIEIRCCVDGPARVLLSEAFPSSKPIALASALKGAKVLLSGTSGVSTLEHDSRVKARELGLHSIGVIDHWVNYRERFIRQGLLVLPDELWVTDEHAHLEASKCFPETQVRQMPNRYLDRLIEEIGIAVQRHAGRTRVLYVLEPIRAKWGSCQILGEFQALDYFLTQLPKLTDPKDVEIRLRPHPSDAANKYNWWVEQNKTCDISVDDSRSLPEAISWSDWVVGCETYAMVVALKAKKQVFSSLPPEAPICRLPFPEIIRLANM